MSASTCRSCKAPIVWGTTKAGKAVPLDPPQKRYIVGDSGLDYGRLKMVQTWVSHFSTCPFADQHRKPKVRYKCPSCGYTYVTATKAGYPPPPLWCPIDETTLEVVT